jgi:hypothetical protein
MRLFFSNPTNQKTYESMWSDMKPSQYIYPTTYKDGGDKCPIANTVQSTDGGGSCTMRTTVQLLHHGDEFCTDVNFVSFQIND